MKGPGLPGWRKQQTGGFYKQKLNAGKRSPMLQNESDGTTPGFDEHGFTDQQINDFQREFARMKENGELPEDFSWKQFYSNKTQTQEGVTEKELSITKLPGGGTGKSWIKRWDELPDKEKGKYGDIKEFIKAGEDYWDANPRVLALLRQKTTPPEEKTEVKDDVEMTNFRISLNRIGQGTHTVKKDEFDGSFRYRASASGRLNHIGTGELSAADIHQGVLDGKWKYETNPNGKRTGNLLMSKNYYEEYQEQENNYERGQQGLAALKAKVDNITSSKTKYNYIKEQLLAQNPELENKKWFNESRGYKQDFPKKYLDHWSNANKQYHEDNKQYFDDKACGYCSKDKDPANLGGILPMILPDDEGYGGGANKQVLRPQDWEWSESENKLVLKDGALSVPNDVWEKMNKEDKNNHNAKLNVNHPHHGKNKSEEQIAAYNENFERYGPTPYHSYKADVERYNALTEEEKKLPENKELYKDLKYAFATKDKNLNVARQSGNIETDFVSGSTNIDDIEIDDEGNVIN